MANEERIDCTTQRQEMSTKSASRSCLVAEPLAKDAFQKKRMSLAAVNAVRSGNPSQRRLIGFGDDDAALSITQCRMPRSVLQSMAALNGKWNVEVSVSLSSADWRLRLLEWGRPRPRVPARFPTVTAEAHKFSGSAGIPLFEKRSFQARQRIEKGA